LAYLFLGGNYMRRLSTSDLIKTASLLGKIGREVKLAPDMSNAEIGLVMFSAVATKADAELKELLAGIAEMTIEEFEKQPFDYPLELIEQLAEQEDLSRFFTRVKALQAKLSSKSVTK
jgi:hypothetical protein